jgi:3-methyladenine DNA glycosylase/8-oxoguanine DNA glycosylase
MKLKLVHTTVIYPTTPYNFNYSVHNPTHYPDKLNKWEPGRLWFSFRFKGKLIGIKFENQGTVLKPKIKAKFYYKTKLNEEYINLLLKELDYRFEFKEGYSKFYEKFERDRLVGKILKKFKGMKNFCREGLYEYLMIAILLQNTNVKRTVQMTNAMLKDYGEKIEFDGIKLYSIWKPERIIKVPEEELRALKVGYRAKSFLRATEDCIKINEFSMRNLNDIDLRKELLKIYGVGPASVDYIMTGVYHRDVLDTIMPWEAKIYSKLLGLKTTNPNEIMTFLDRLYGEYKSKIIGHLFMDVSWKHKYEKLDWMEKLLPFAHEN